MNKNIKNTCKKHRKSALCLIGFLTLLTIFFNLIIIKDQINNIADKAINHESQIINKEDKTNNPDNPSIIDDNLKHSWNLEFIIVRLVYLYLTVIIFKKLFNDFDRYKIKIKIIYLIKIPFVIYILIQIIWIFNIFPLTILFLQSLNIVIIFIRWIFIIRHNKSNYIENSIFCLIRLIHLLLISFMPFISSILYMIVYMIFLLVDKEAKKKDTKKKENIVFDIINFIVLIYVIFFTSTFTINLLIIMLNGSIINLMYLRIGYHLKEQNQQNI